MDLSGSSSSTVTRFIESHPYISLALGFVVGYKIIALTQPAAAGSEGSEKAEKMYGHRKKHREQMNAGNSAANPSMVVMDHVDLMGQPSANPLGMVSNVQWMGKMNPPKRGIRRTQDSRGETQTLRSRKGGIVETPFNKDPRSTDALLDEINLDMETGKDWTKRAQKWTPVS